MAEIHLLPQSINPVAMARAASTLASEFEAGHDLGERGYHIRAIGREIEVLRQHLSQKLDQIRKKDLVEGIVMGDELLVLESFAICTGELAALTADYQAVSNLDEGIESLLRPR